MRTSFCSICAFVLVVYMAKAQNSPDLRTAVPVCANAPINGMANGSGDIDDFDMIEQTGCLEMGSNISPNIEHNTSWYVFRAGTDGQLGFDLEALSPTAEWDFALYGPDVTPTDISNGTAQPIRCNYEANTTNFTGIGINPVNDQQGESPLRSNQNTYDTWLDVKTGEMYYLFINNYNTNSDGDPEPYLLTFTGSLVDSDPNGALDCTLKENEFLGPDIIACQADPSVTLNALRSPAGTDIQSVTWRVDYGDDGTIDRPLTGKGPFNGELEVSMNAFTSGRYYVEIQTISGDLFKDDILIDVHGTPELGEVKILTDMADRNDIEIVPLKEGKYEYSLNGGLFQESPIFLNVPPGENAVVISDLNGCGTSGYFAFFVVGYPKFFTPNADGIHDEWNIIGLAEMETATVYIFDRYGKLLKQLDKTSTGWDGTFNGQPLPSSDYWFRMEYSRQEEGTLVAHSQRSHFTLKR